MNFNDLGLEPELLSAISAHGYDTPTPIQVGAIPPVLAGRDLLAGAQTGTGKTAAFVLPLLQMLGAPEGRVPRTLILAPTPPNSTVERVTQIAYRVHKDDKRHLLVHLFENGANDEGPWNQALVFTRTKHGANRLSQQLERAGIRSAAIHGNKSQAARTRALADFKAGKLAALVATEVASRGLDIRELPQVVNYELPNVPEDYVHRIGRTARAGNEGHAVSLVSQDEAPLLRDIERTMRQSVPFAPTPEFARKEQAPVVQRPAPAAPPRRPANNGRRYQPRRRFG